LTTAIDEKRYGRLLAKALPVINPKAERDLALAIVEGEVAARFSTPSGRATLLLYVGVKSDI
jgi:predicted nuclease of restriction endonuclease-like RecB superfamily